MSAEPEILGLVDKYRRMTELRAELGRGAPSAADRERLRALARDFPGALRELETLDTVELARRHDTAVAAAAGAEPPPWLRWTASYHALMRQALTLRAGRADPNLDGELADAIRSPTHGRLNVVVFAALSRRFATPASVIWDTLFPRRGTASRPYRAS